MSVLSRRPRLAVALASGALVGAGLVGAQLAAAAHSVVTLPGSTFEIDSDANLLADDAGMIDWASVGETRQKDSPSGSGDEAFGNGTKEDTAVPSVVTGSIPPNKSDLKWFGLHQTGSGSSGFLNLYWSRVQDPQGTTNMDFEFNKNKCEAGAAGSRCSGNGITPVRTAGDLLLTYDLSNGGTKPSLSLRTWSGSAWGTAVDLTSSGKATGSINASPIAESAADGLGVHSARTFGEAQIALSAVLGTECKTFGSAYLKSRSSDSFTAAVKDFVPPQAVDITNCGSVRITKQGSDTNGAGLNGAGFTLYKNVAPLAGPRDGLDTATTLTCLTAGTGADAGTCTISDVPLGNYWVVETLKPALYDFAPDQAISVTGPTPVAVTVIDPRGSAETTLTTQQRWLPNHQATVSAAPGQGDLAGTLTFSMYENATCSGTAKYTLALPVTGALTKTLSTSNTSVYTTDRTVSWKVAYVTSNQGHFDRSNVCDVSSLDVVNNFVTP